MKKSTLLTVASVGAVALTSAMTFAAWDKLTATSTEAAVTFKQINVTEDATTSLSLNAPGENTNLSESYTPEAVGAVQFNVAGMTEYTGTKMMFKPTVMEGQNNVTDYCDVKIYESADTTKTTDLAKDGDNTVDATNKYTVVVSPKTDDTSRTKVDNKALTVKVDATLTK